MRKYLFFAVFLFAISFSVAQSTCLIVNADNTQDYFNEISSLNSQLSTCSVSVPSNVYKLVGDGNIRASISMDDGTTEFFYVTIQNKEVTGLMKGNPSSYTFDVQLSESTLDSLLTSSDAANAILAGVKSGTIKIKAHSFWGGVKWFFAKFFLPSPAPVTQKTPVSNGPTGKPENCDETYLPGHNGYAENQYLWDSYSSDTDKVCQSQYGRGIPSPCVHTVQLSVQGNPYYLCWYNE